MKLTLSTHLRAYTGGQASVEVSGDTLTAAMADLDRRYPGLRFRIIDEQDRIRQHIAIFVNRRMVDTLDLPLQPSDELHIIGSLSGGAARADD